MALRYNLRNEEPRTQAVARVMQWVLAQLTDEKETAISISISISECGHAGCGGNETIIFLTRAGGLVTKFKIAKPVETVAQADVANALTSPVAAREL